MLRVTDLMNQGGNDRNLDLVSLIRAYLERVEALRSMFSSGAGVPQRDISADLLNKVFDLYREMESLNEKVNKTLTSFSPVMQKLLGIDALIEKVISENSRVLVSAVEGLESYFEKAGYTELAESLRGFRNFIRERTEQEIRSTRLNLQTQFTEQISDSLSRTVSSVFGFVNRATGTEFLPVGETVGAIRLFMYDLPRLSSSLRMIPQILESIGASGGFAGFAGSLLSSIGAILTNPVFIAAAAAVTVAVLGTVAVDNLVKAKVSEVMNMGGGVAAAAGIFGNVGEIGGYGFGDLFRAFGFSWRRLRTEAEVLGYGMRWRELERTEAPLVMQSMFELSFTQGLREAARKGDWEEFAKKSEEAFTKGLVNTAAQLRVFERAMGVSGNVLMSQMQFLRGIAGETDLTRGMALTYRWYLQAMESGIEFQRYMSYIREFAEGLRDYGYNLRTAEQITREFSEELRTGVVRMSELNRTIAGMFGWNQQQMFMQYAMAMLFGHPELRATLGAYGPVGGAVLMNILQRTSYGNLDEALAMAERSGNTVLVNVIRQIMALGAGRYEQLATFARTLPYELPLALGGMLGGGGPASLLLANVVGAPMGFTLDWGNLYRGVATYTALGEAVRRAPEEYVQRITLTDEDIEKLSKATALAIKSMQAEEGFWSTFLNGVIRKFFASNDFKNVITGAIENARRYNE